MAATAVRLPGITFETRHPPVATPLPRMDIAGFVGFTRSGPINVPVAVEDVPRFHDVFGEDVTLAADESTGGVAYAELPLRLARTITPAFAHRFVFSIAATRATSWLSPVKVR